MKKCGPQLCRFAVRALLALVLATSIPAMAASYNGPDGGFWNTPANWLGGAVPVNNDAVNILPTGPGKNVIFNGNYGAPGLNILALDEPGFGTSGISQAINNMVVVQEQIGLGGRGRYTQTGGSNFTQSVLLGILPGSSGSYELSANGILSVNSFMYIGNTGNGTLTQSGGQLTVGQQGLSLAGGAGGSGAYYLSAGSADLTNLNIATNGGYGSIQQTGGTVSVSNTLNNGSQGSYSLAGGTLSANLSNSGAFYINGGFFSGGGVNNSSFNFSSGTFNNTTGFSNFGSITLAGGTFANTASLTNYGQIQINANIAISIAAPFNNENRIIQNNGNLDISGAGQFTNDGNMQLATGWAINFFNTNPINNGTINLNGGRIGGSAFLINRPGATITGSGLIFSLGNQGGRLLLTSGTTRVLVSSPNTGIIELADSAASLSGGLLTNSGQIVGHGSIGNDINNSGIVEASGGNLILGGALTNAAIGTFGCPESGKIIAILGMSSNAGLINLTGGTFDNNGFAINNTGQISGFGTFRTGGLTNNGSITFTGGFTTINGNVTNAAAHQIKVAHNPALFTGDVTNNGTFKNTSTTITFSGAYHEFGTYISDPADNYFSNVSIGATGAWIGGQGDHFILTGNLVGRALLPDSWQTNQAELRFTGGTDHLLSLLGNDLGIDFSGYDNNFAWGTLTLGAGDHLSLEGDGGALYVRELILPGGLAQIENILGNNHNIYYDLREPANTYLGGQSYSLAGGGQLTPIPEPAAIIFELSALFMLMVRRRKNVN